MNFLLDENFPSSARTVVEDLGHQVFDFRKLGEIGAPDTEIMKMAFTKYAAILTTDRDFFHTLGRQYPGHHGIIVIALKRPTRASIMSRLEWFLKRFKPEEISGRAFQLRDQAWMVYPPLNP